MTGPVSSVHPAVGPPDRLALAEFDAGLPEEPEAVLVAAHVEGCADCRQILAGLRAARTDLAGLAGTPMPPAIAARIAATVAAEQDGGRHRAPVIELRSERRMRRLRVASGLAAGIVLLGGVGYRLVEDTGGTDATTSAVDGVGEEAAPDVDNGAGTAALPSYDRQSLEARVEDLLARAPGETAEGPMTTADDELGADTAVDAACLARIPLETSEALSISRVIYEGRSAIVVIFPGEPARVQVTVVSDCAESAVPSVIDEFTAED
ncbi:MAG: hypothetical protein ACR2JK_16375 [Geodermatophilaceae bacterium]